MRKFTNVRIEGERMPRAKQRGVARTPLDADRIADAALSVAAAGGADAVSMRSVAQALGSSPMALYHHVPDKAAMVALMVEEAVKRHPPPPQLKVWRQELRSIANWMIAHNDLFPSLTPLVKAHNVWTPSGIEITQRWVAGWRKSSLDAERALLAAAASSVAIVALSTRDLNHASRNAPRNGMIKDDPLLDEFFSIPTKAANDLAIRALIDGFYGQLMHDQKYDRSKQKPKAAKAPQRRRRD